MDADARVSRSPGRPKNDCTPSGGLAKPGVGALIVRPLTPSRWPDLEALFAMRGCSIARSCWCMAYRRSASRLPELPPGRTRSQANRAALHALVQAKQPPGLIAYDGKQPVGWVSLGPREDFGRLAASPIMKPVDDRPTWSIICFVVPPEFRGQGVAGALLRGAIAHAKKRGARLLEAYPVDKPGRQSDDSMWFGPMAMYTAAGFEEVARRKATRPVVRIVPA